MSRKSELLDMEDKRWHDLCERIERVADLDKPGVNGDWSAKDVLAHVAAWHALTTDRLEQLRSHGDLGPRPDIDAFNAEIYDECRAMPVSEIKAMSAASRHRFREELALLGDDPDDKIATLIAGNAHDHYDEHIPDLDRFLEAQ